MNGSSGFEKKIPWSLNDRREKASQSGCSRDQENEHMPQTHPQKTIFIDNNSCDGTSTTGEPRLLVGTCKVVGLKENSDPGEPCKKPPNYEMPEARFLPGAKV